MQMPVHYFYLRKLFQGILILPCSHAEPTFGLYPEKNLVRLVCAHNRAPCKRLYSFLAQISLRNVQIQLEKLFASFRAEACNLNIDEDRLTRSCSSFARLKEFCQACSENLHQKLHRHPELQKTILYQ